MKVEFSNHSGSLFHRPSLHEREEAQEGVLASIARVEEQLDGRLKLPPKVKVSFFKSEGKRADVMNQPPRLRISLVHRLMQDADRLDKILAHEFSHLSDIAEGNNCQNTYLFSRAGLFLHYKAISEGKAQHVSEEVSGSGEKLGIPDHLIDDVYRDTAILARPRVLAYLPVLGRMVVEEGARMLRGDNIGFGSATDSYVNPYSLGYEVVRDAMVGAEVTSVFDIHTMPVQFYLQSARIGHAQRTEQIGQRYEVPA